MRREQILATRDTLEAMGLTLYRARYPLPGAAVSPVFPDAAPAWADPAPAARQTGAAFPPGGPVTPAARGPAATAALPGEGSAERPEAAPPRAMPVPAPGALAPFTLAAVALGGALWLEELADGVLGRDQVNLMRGICRALGWPTEPAGINQFTWPMHRNPQLDQSEEAAHAALSAFVQRQMEAGNSSRLILLGGAVQRRLGDLASGATVLRTRATGEMLREPLLKRDVWRDLRQH